jgi:hypothetical protein
VIAIETLREEASRLPLEDRAAFAAFVLQTLPAPVYSVSDSEVVRRLEDLRSGNVEGVTTAEIFQQVASQAT